MYLLDYVQTPYFTEENVNSEKGIITQEIHMGEDNPINVLYEHIRTSCFHDNSFKNSIIGTVEDINSVTKELLQACYDRFYHPSNMFLVITGNFNPHEVIDKIKENQNKKQFNDNLEFKMIEKSEKDSVVKKEDYVKINTNLPKIAYNIKINYNNLDIPKRKINLYMYIIFLILFDDTSIFDEKLKENETIINSIGINILNADSHILVSLINETNKYNELIKEIDKELENIEISRADLERKKRVIISNEIFSYENIEFVNEMIIDNIIFDGRIENNIIDLVNSLNVEELNKKIDFSNRSIVVVSNEDKDNKFDKKKTKDK